MKDELWRKRTAQSPMQESYIEFKQLYSDFLHMLSNSKNVF